MGDRYAGQRRQPVGVSALVVYVCYSMQYPRLRYRDARYFSIYLPDAVAANMTGCFMTGCFGGVVCLVGMDFDESSLDIFLAHSHWLDGVDHCFPRAVL